MTDAGAAVDAPRGVRIGPSLIEVSGWEGVEAMAGGDDDVPALIERWDHQQEGYIQQREARFAVMFDVLTSALGDGFAVADAACGPGSLNCRFLDRLPRARVPETV